MGKAARKLNFLIEESICKELEALVPPGKRSKVANDALRRELERISRRDVVDRILSIGEKGKKFSNRQIIEALSKDRATHRQENLC
jgi:hypothetical protein